MRVGGRLQGHPGVPGNLPQELTSFIGRRKELSDIRHRLSAARLVTLIGPAGVGKTRLALRAAAQSPRQYPDGVWLAELAVLPEPALLAEAVAAALGLPEQAGIPPLERLTDFLRERTVLLVLDNCEHLVTACAALADRLLRECPGVQILATSREPLIVAGESIVGIPPLSLPDRPATAASTAAYEAVALFVARAGDVVADFRLTAGNHEAVAAVCHRLDGLPLAIELAAARLRLLSPEQLLERLTDRFALLTGGSRAAPSRQQTLRACIDWSFNLCTPAERRLWARLSVFSGGFELDAIAAVAADEGFPAKNVRRVVSGLVDKSILLRETRGDVVRFRLLEAIREYGHEALHAGGEVAELRRRHRDWVQRLVLEAEADLIGSRQVQLWTRLDRELPNIRAGFDFGLSDPAGTADALRMVVALHAYWKRRRLSEGRQWIDRALQKLSGPPTEIWLRATHDGALLACLQGDLADAAVLGERARELAGQLGDARAWALSGHTEANVALFSGDLPRAAERFDEILPQHRAAGDVPRLLEALIARSMTAGLLGDGPTAVACHQEILAITEPRGEFAFRSYALYGLGVALWRQGRPERAAELLRQALRLKLTVDDPLSASFCLAVLGWIAAGAAQYPRAAHLLGAAQSLSAVARSPISTVRDMAQFHAECQQRTREALGEQRFAAEYATGTRLTFPEAVAYALGDKPLVPAPGLESTLTGREQQVADLIAEGRSNKEIAAKLVISTRTAEGHVERILGKLGLTSRAQVSAWVTAQRASADRGSPAPIG